MNTVYPNRKVLIAFIILFSVSFLIVEQPTHQAQSAVVFSNMPQVDDGALIVIQPNWPAAVIFDVPAGLDYTVNSVDMRLVVAVAGGGNINAAIHVDNAGAAGAVVVDLGSGFAFTSPSTVTYTPTGASTLAAGQRYWLVLTGADSQWRSSNPGVTPAGDFIYVDNGRIRLDLAGIFQSFDPERFSFTMDADPIPAPVPPSGGGNVAVACSETDSRVNSLCEEPYQTAAIYCLPNGGIDVYDVTTGEGWLTVRVSSETIAEIGVPSTNTRLGQSEDGTIRLYRLASGEFQVNAPRWDNVQGNLPDGYIFIWDGCS